MGRNRATFTKRLVGKRSPRGTIDPENLIEELRTLALRLRQEDLGSHDDIRALKTQFASACRTYYTGAAVSRRARLDDQVRQSLLALLYPVRSSIEKSIVAALRKLPDQDRLLREAAGRSFFGVSAKQGVSIRYALASCVPTKRCAGGCYAHDGRDRELHLIFRGVLNYYFGQMYEEGGAAKRRSLVELLRKSIDYGIGAARADAFRAAQIGVERAPRIRFSHVGEMAQTPSFTNALGKRIREQAPEIRCVIYTRHPNASLLDPSVFVVNFTLEGSADSRKRFAPASARIVSSAWDGVLSPDAEINFLEHHVEKTAVRNGRGSICPVTADHRLKSCDAAGCTRCFEPLVHIRR